MGFKVLDHTADFGIRVWADTKSGLFEEAARALFTEMLRDINAIEPKQVVEFELEGETDEDLMVAWLSELLFYLDVDGLAFSKFEVKLDDGKLKARAWGDKVELSKELRKGVKAVTYHEMKIENVDGKWQTDIIFDT